ncbi:DUF742 domain-containing protein [Nocardia sp. alder85J]|uniref:DUF742 domain-containing protein n=1 Tax=Nocardia sp. alder85J TaxID=2862949 RepID=UPI001CD4B9F1|nr:DUF742 domain-containing protein [Nocardia sp. alder85J]MCX4092332.1 DUF742 domain-containing protein [Nocardia sp. alder85J]
MTTDESSGRFDRDGRDDLENIDSDDEFVRPFVVTGGRTTPVIDGLRIETLVQAPRSALSAPLQLEQRTVVELCQEPLSIAEIGAALHVPVGLAKVIVSDLAAAGFLTVQESADLTVSAIERIRNLVRAL